MATFLRIGLPLAIVGLAVACLSSATLAAVVGIVTAVIVAVDMIAFSRGRTSERPCVEPPDKLSVDLSRRR